MKAVAITDMARICFSDTRLIVLAVAKYASRQQDNAAASALASPDRVPNRRAVVRHTVRFRPVREHAKCLTAAGEFLASHVLEIRRGALVTLWERTEPTLARKTVIVSQSVGSS